MKRWPARKIVHQLWLPDVEVWQIGLGLMVVLTAVNLTSARSYGEFEFWFASIKVVAIVVFIVVAAGWLFGIGNPDSPGVSNLTAQGASLLSAGPRSSPASPP